MFYPIGWHKILRLDSDPRSKILTIIANSERELFLILTTTSIHLWNPRPSIEIACHRRSDESLEQIGANKNVVWKIDSSVFVIATDKDQLLFFKLHQRLSNSTWSSFMSLSNNPEIIGLYKLRCELKNLRNTLGDHIYKELLRTKVTDSKHQTIPAISIVATGKLDLTSIGVSCLMAAEEELIVGGKDGDFYGIHWNGNVDDKFPWSIKGVPIRGNTGDKSKTGANVYIKDIKFSSVLSGFAMVFTNGRATFMSLKETMSGSETPPEQTDKTGSQSPESNTSSNNNNNNNNNISNTNNNNKLIYLPGDNNAICVEINHKYRLIALGTEDSRIIVCNVSEPSTSVSLNHILEFRQDKFPNIHIKLGPVKNMRYSPDSFALASSWQSGHIALWSLFGSLLFCSEQWRLDSFLERPIFKAANICWGREGHSLWVSTTKGIDDELSDEMATTHDKNESNCINNINDDPSIKTNDNNTTESNCCNNNETSSANHSYQIQSGSHREDLVIISIAHSTLSSSPHLTCSSDSIVLLSEDRVHIGPSVPHEAEFDNWHVVDIPYDYLAWNYPIRYATVDRTCNELAIAGNNGFAIYNIATSKWTMFNRKTQELGFTICGDIMWWNGYLIMSCYNIETENFEIRAYATNRARLDNDSLISQIVPFEVIRMSLFENRLLVLYSDGSFAMFMMNLRKRPRFNASNSMRKLSSASSTSAASTPTATPTADVLQSDLLTATLSLPDANNEQHQKQEANATSNQIQPKLKRSDSIISSFSLRRQSVTSTNNNNSNYDISLQISPMQNLIVSNLQANPYCISSVSLTRLHFKNNRLDDSILLNYCGKLFLLERESPAKRSGVAFQAVSVIATNVEQFWISPEISTASEMSYFRKSLWLSCGRGTANSNQNNNLNSNLNNNNNDSSNSSNAQLQVWLPLLNDKADSPSDLYVPDRIMLPIKCDIYPLAIRSSSPNDTDSDDAIVLGAENDILYRDNSELFSEFPFCTVKRQCRVYLHRILRELLLKQHLGYYARKIAESCQTLPYFAHCFELLLHEVLEEEATSPIPLPDPMLPQVVEFIKKFPVYLETVVHCARKSELSMWSHLFADQAVGDPQNLFRECIERGKLDTASSCLLILQSLDKMVSHKMLQNLMVAARLEPKFYYLIEDLEKFSIRAELEKHDTNDAITTEPPTNMIPSENASNNNIPNADD